MADPPGQRVAQAAPERPAGRRSRPGAADDQVGDVEHAAQPFIRWRSSASAAGPAAEDGDDDAEAHHHLGRGHHQDEEHQHLPADVVQGAGERDEGEVGGVEHELDAHEHDQHVSAHQHAEGADGEEHGSERQVPGRVDGHEAGLRSVPPPGPAGRPGVGADVSPVARGRPVGARAGVFGRGLGLRSASVSSVAGRSGRHWVGGGPAPRPRPRR